VNLQVPIEWTAAAGRIRRLAPLLLLIAVVVAAYATGLTRYLSFAPIREHGHWLREEVREHYLISLLVYFLAYAALTTTAIPGAIFVTLTGGFLFGTWVGGFTTSAAATLGALNVYFIMRTAFGHWLGRHMKESQGLMGRMRRGLEQNAFWFLFGLRVVPAVPFIGVNITAGLVSVPVKPYALATFLGILPAFLLYSAIGSKLGRFFDHGREPDLKTLLLEPQFIALMVGVGFLSFVLPFVLRHLHLRGRAGEPTPKS
jgi:uncharacterized membrane protein YdjX (TVP38/TMEM64 family)